MRILLLSMYFAPDVAANAAVMSRLVDELAGRGHEVTVVTTFPHYAENVVAAKDRRHFVRTERRGRVRVIHTYLYTSPQKDQVLGRALSYGSFTLLAALVGVCAGPQDVILAPSPPLTVGLAAFFVGRAKGIPYVYNVQDINPEVAERLGILTGARSIALARRLEQFVYRHAGHITVLTEGFRANLIAKGVSPEKVTVIPNFVDPDFIRPLPAENGFRQRYALSDRRVVLYAGNLGYAQALEQVLLCAARLRDREDIVFAFVGNGAQRRALETQAREMQLGNVRFIAFQPQAELPQVYAAADVSLVTLRRGLAQVSMPSKVYTIMASARPVVAAVDPGSDIWKLVERARCGRCVESERPEALARAIESLCDDAALRERLGRNGREYVARHHAPDLIGQAYQDLLMRLAGT